MEERCRGWINDEGEQVSGEICLFLMGLDQSPMRRFPEFPRQWRHQTGRMDERRVNSRWNHRSDRDLRLGERRGSGSLMKFNSQRVAFD